MLRGVRLEPSFRIVASSVDTPVHCVRERVKRTSICFITGRRQASGRLVYGFHIGKGVPRF